MSDNVKNTIRDYGIALGVVVLATIPIELFQLTRGAAYPIVLLFAIAAAAWRGYGPGLLASLLCLYVVPFLTRPAFTIASVGPARPTQALVISVFVSLIARSQRQARAALSRGNEDLEERVRKRTAELERAERRLQDVLNSVSESFLALDRNWRFTFVNKRIAESLGKPAEQVVGSVIWDVFPKASDSEFYTQYKRVLDEQVSVHFEMYYEPSSRWLEVDAHPTPEGLSAYVVDITGRKQYEANLARLASIVESSGDAIVSKDLNGVILTWNPAAERIYGYAAQEVIGSTMESVVPTDKLSEERSILDDVRRGGRIQHFETTRTRKDGTRIDVSLTISPLRDAAGQIVGASHVARDITEQKNFERQLHQVQKLESLGVLAGGVAHDFNNLLVGIVGNASLALDDAPPNIRQSLLDVLNAGERAADLTRQLLAYAGKGKVHPRLIDLSALVRDISTLVRSSMSRSVQLRLELPDSLPGVLADSGQIQQIVMNLVINAAEAIGNEQPGTVTVSTSYIDADEHYLAATLGVEGLPSGHYVTLEVSDTGCGMDDETIAKIFDPFFTTKFLGRGLGLSAALGIVRSHGGALKVYSEPGRGTTFRVLLPAAAGAVESLATADSGESLQGSGTVLIVDDDDMVRNVARAALSKQGYSILEAANGELGLSVLRENVGEIRAVLLDLTMPVMGGEEALRHISVSCPNLPVVLSSGFSEGEAMKRFAGKGVAAFVQKPYTAAQLARTMRGVFVSAKSA